MDRVAGTACSTEGGWGGEQKDREVGDYYKWDANGSGPAACAGDGEGGVEGSVVVGGSLTAIVRRVGGGKDRVG